MPEPHDPLVAVDLYGTGIHPQSWRRPDSRAEDLFTAGYWTGLLGQADSAGVDLAFVGDTFAIATTGHADQRGQLDAVAIAARAVASTERIGLVPTVTVTHTEPFHVSKAIASLDHASLGRAGWQVDVSAGQAQANLFGRKEAQDAESLWAEAADAIEVVSLLWDSWEDDAEIRDVATGRFIDRDKLHYIDFEGTHFSVKGPSITPRSPQGQSLIVIGAPCRRSRRSPPRRPAGSGAKRGPGPPRPRHVAPGPRRHAPRPRWVRRCGSRRRAPRRPGWSARPAHRSRSATAPAATAA